MRWLINYIRSCFCKHDFELLSKTNVYWNKTDTIPMAFKWTFRCKKCGYVQKIKD